MERPSKRQKVADLLHSSGALRAILALRNSARLPWLSILTYHRFADPSSVEAFDDGVVDAALPIRGRAPDERKFARPTRALQ